MIWAVIFGVLALQALGQTPAGGSISGRVLNSVTGVGVAGVTVTACPANACYGPQSRKQGVSDDLGAYRIAGIPDGQYGVSAAEVRGFSPNRSLPNLRVFGDVRLDIQMTPLASLRGRVLDPEGNPAAGIKVNIPSVPGEKITDEKGEFVFEDLAPRPYTLSATPKSQPDAKEGERVVTTYYPSAVEITQAVQIPVRGVDLFGYDIRMRTALAREVRGVVLDVDGKPAPGARVSIYKLTPGMVTIVRGSPGLSGGYPQAVAAASPVETKEDGTFAFPPVLEGEWKVGAVLRPMTDSARGGSVDVNVSTRAPEGSESDHLEVRLAERFEIRLTADWGDSPPAYLPLGLSLNPLDGPEGSLGNFPEPGQSKTFRLIAGRFVVVPGSAPPGSYLAAVMLGNRDVLGQVVEITGPEPLRTIYKTGGGSVQGTVENCADATVAVMADATLTSRLGFSARCDANGRFAIADVPPGEYTAVAFAELNLLFSPGFPEVLASSGKRVKVEAGAAAQVELQVVRQ
jgi:Carboxypeptidase regulatory-like domain